ncbi:MAG: hypothetical protein IPN69_08085 [Acidobacteria bacterium]|nr:hypothetical protein [Acidobacteriota bacterium]
MSKTLSKYEENRAAAEARINETITDAGAKRDQNLLKLGAVGAVGRLAQHLNAQTIRALQHVRDEKMFDSLGFTRFDDFLNDSEISPMTYRQFNDREKLLLQEGDQLFDLMTSLKLSVKQRRLLGSGNVEVDDERGVVRIARLGDDECADDVEEIEITDRDRLLQTLSAVADQAAKLNDKVNKLEIRNQRGEAQNVDLRRQLDEARDRAGTVTLFDLALTASRTIEHMTSWIEDGNTENGETYLDMLRSAIVGYESALRGDDFKQVSGKRAKSATANNDDVSGVVESLTDDELAGLMD